LYTETRKKKTHKTETEITYIQLDSMYHTMTKKAPRIICTYKGNTNGTLRITSQIGA